MLFEGELEPRDIRNYNLTELADHTNLSESRSSLKTSLNVSTFVTLDSPHHRFPSVKRENYYN